MSNVTDVLVCASSFLDPKVLNGLTQGLQLASAVGIVVYYISLGLIPCHLFHFIFIPEITVPFVPGATLALALVNVVLEKISQVVENDVAVQELRTECQVMSQSVNVV